MDTSTHNLRSIFHARFVFLFQLHILNHHIALDSYMTKFYYLALLLAMAPLSGYAVMQSQQQDEPKEMDAPFNHRPQRQTRPSTYNQVDEVRNKLGLSHEQFNKVYNAYSKYNKAIYGDDSSASSGMNGRPQGMGGGPGGMGGGPSGMGGGPQGGMNAPQRRQEDKPMSEKDIEKMHKKMQKQEEKLNKSMRKVLSSDQLYEQWLGIRQTQIPHFGEEMPPEPPANDIKRQD